MKTKLDYPLHPFILPYLFEILHSAWQIAAVLCAKNPETIVQLKKLWTKEIQ